MSLWQNRFNAKRKAAQQNTSFGPYQKGHKHIQRALFFPTFQVYLLSCRFWWPGNRMRLLIYNSIRRYCYCCCGGQAHTGKAAPEPEPISRFIFSGQYTHSIKHTLIVAQNKNPLRNIHIWVIRENAQTKPALSKQNHN